MYIMYICMHVHNICSLRMCVTHAWLFVKILRVVVRWIRNRSRPSTFRN